MNRLNLRAGIPGRFEKFNFLKKVSDNYDLVAFEDSSYVIVDASMSRDDVFSYVLSRLPEI